ncbi:MAG: hypothetical protein B6241_15400 [Spirochaetaceae bacterium 4572_59]|nr:MAG: hypothetical protein B6241_15400 [Spirochaetaceae bacterium 4572_59]
MVYKDDNHDRTYIELENNWINNISHFGRLKFTKKTEVLPEHIHKNLFEFCYLPSGQVTFHVAGKSFNIKGGDVFIAFPNEIHSTGGTAMARIKLFWLGIDLSDNQNGFLGYSKDEGRQLLSYFSRIKNRHFRGNNNLGYLIDRIIDLYLSDYPLKKILIRNLITEFMIQISDLEVQGTENQISPIIMNSIFEIKQRIPEKISLQELARTSGLSPGYFKIRFKKEVGMPPGEYILKSKIERAEEFLREGHTVTETAFEFGFSSSQHFSTMFKTFRGMSPGKWLKNEIISSILSQ